MLGYRWARYRLERTQNFQDYLPGAPPQTLETGGSVLPRFASGDVGFGLAGG
jgi:hypothetical protein